MLHYLFFLSVLGEEYSHMERFVLSIVATLFASLQALKFLFFKSTMDKFRNRNYNNKKSRIRETKNLSTDADRRTDTILERLRDLLKK